MWANGLLLLGGLVSGAALAEEPDPPPELLEFLGSFETSAGEAIDPTLLDLPPAENTPPTAEQGADHD